jgi:hypothetical protein
VVYLKRNHGTYGKETERYGKEKQVKGLTGSDSTLTIFLSVSFRLLSVCSVVFLLPVAKFSGQCRYGSKRRLTN